MNMNISPFFPLSLLLFFCLLFMCIYEEEKEGWLSFHQILYMQWLVFIYLNP